MRTALLKAEVQGTRLTLRLRPDEVFVPNLMSWFSAAAMRVRPGETFLDVGTGCGLHAILAAKLGARLVLATDISPVALRLARENARLNGVARACRFLQGFLARPLVERGLRADAMIYNAPHFPARLIDPTLPRRLRDSVGGGSAGGDLNALFLCEAPRALAPDGRILNPVVAWSDPATSERAKKKAGYHRRVLARVHIPAWGRGNNTRAWLLKRPGRHAFSFRHAPGRDTEALIEELTLDAAGTSPAAWRVTMDFNLT